MLPSNFYKELSFKIQQMNDSQKRNIFDEDTLKILQKVSESCQKSEKFLVLVNRTYNSNSLSKFVKYFNLSLYHKSSHTTLFLTNFDGLVFTKMEDDRYRFLKSIYPECQEFKNLEERRNIFFKNVMK